MNTLATAVRRMLSEGRQGSHRNRLALSAVEREALERISPLLDGSTRWLAAALDGIGPDGAWIFAPDYASVTG